MTEILGEEVVDIVLKEIQDELETNSKICTRRTYESQRGEFAILRESIRWFFFSDEGLVHIQNGKRAGTKLPMFKQGNEFKLVPRLQEWVDEKGAVAGSDYGLAKHIADNSRAGVPIVKPALERALPKIRAAIALATAREIEKELATKIRNIYAA